MFKSSTKDEGDAAALPADLSRLEIDKIKGLAFELSVQGSGSARIGAADVSVQVTGEGAGESCQPADSARGRRAQTAPDP